jgi:Cys-rich protein (TIGR01571 family)
MSFRGYPNPVNPSFSPYASTVYGNPNSFITNQITPNASTFTNNSSGGPYLNNQASTTTTTIITHQPNRAGRSQLVYDNNWGYGLCDCCSDCRLFCFAFWCFPCFLCCLFVDAQECPLTSCGYCGVCMLRTKLRGTYRIHGSICEDIVTTVFCAICAAIQMQQELIYQGESKR